MRAVIQRVNNASVEVDGDIIAQIARGLVILLAVGQEDNDKDQEYMAEKLLNLRIFPDEEGKMNRSLLDVGGELLVVSQFTLYGDCRKGRRPSYTDAASPLLAKKGYENFVLLLKSKGLKVATGEFQAHMHISSVNDGPVTILIDSKKLF